jgi:hypothetical protein
MLQKHYLFRYSEDKPYFYLVMDSKIQTKEIKEEEEYR